MGSNSSKNKVIYKQLAYESNIAGLSFIEKSTLIGYLMPNTIFSQTHVYMICKQIVFKHHYFKMSQSSFMCTQLNGLKNCYLTWIILFNINNNP